jgi:geranylgeranylglycerol-phosphate geranylgeranyltransferase
MFYTFLLLLFLYNTNAYRVNNQIVPRQIIPTHRLYGVYNPTSIITTYNDNPMNNSKIQQIQRKISSMITLIRPQNILPTSVLCFSGGWIMNPSFVNLIQTKSFAIATLNTLLIMSCSMVLNDLFDIEVDKINNPTRPLITGEITKKEAILLSLGLLSITEILSVIYFPRFLQYIIHAAILNIIAYTPFLKKIPIIKNISCAALISFSVIFSGLATNMNIMGKIDVLITFVRLLFFGSLYNEIILDIRDYDGDKLNGINTIPVVFGKDVSLCVLFMITDINIIWNAFSLYKLYGTIIACILPILCNQLLVNLYFIKKYNYSVNSLTRSIQTSFQSLYSILLYLCIIISMKK